MIEPMPETVETIYTLDIKTMTQRGKDQEKSGFRVILEGMPGSGKTSSLNTLAEECGLETFIAFLEPGSHVIRPHHNIHYNRIKTMTQSWESMRENAKKIQNYGRKELFEQIPDTRSFPQFFELLELLNNFTDIDGNEYGDVCDFGPDKVLIIDGLTGLSKIAMSLVIGDRPVRHISDYGIAMDNLQKFIDKCTESLNCHFVLVSHLEREHDEVTGGIYNMVSTLGQKLAPVIPNEFTDVILCKRDGADFLWSTLEHDYTLKHFYLPLSDNIPPTFKGVYDSWKEKSNGV